MINTVEKIYIDGNENKYCFKVTKDNEILFVPNSVENTDYKEIQEWVVDGGTITDPGV
jgi:hypothetical protein